MIKESVKHMLYCDDMIPPWYKMPSWWAMFYHNSKVLDEMVAENQKMGLYDD